MKLRPILFSTTMVQAILDGRKTQTRRVVKPQPGDHPNDDGYMSTVLERCPYGKPGDILWVRETWTKDSLGRYYHKATTDTVGEEMRLDYIRSGCAWAKWRPSIHMPFAAARIFLRIKSVRVEKLQDISCQDVLREGMESGHDPAFKNLWQSINGPESWNANPWVWVVEFERISREEAGL